MTPHTGPIASRLSLPPPEPQPSCTWTSSPAGETAAYPCTGHEGGAHVFADGRRLSLAVTAVTFPPLAPAGPGASVDVREFLAVRGLLSREG